MKKIIFLMSLFILQGAFSMDKISLPQATEFLNQWYLGWDKVFSHKDDQSVCDDLSVFLSDSNVALNLPSGTINNRADFISVLKSFQASQFIDKHTLEAVRDIGDNTFITNVSYQRLAPVQLALHTKVEVKLAIENNKIVITNYIPSFSIEEIQIRQVMQGYLEAFQALSIDETAPFYNIPVMMTAPTGLVVLSSSGEVSNFLNSNFEGLRNQNYVRSNYSKINVHVLTSNSAIVSAIVSRFNAEGEEIFKSAATYQLMKSADKWVIIHGVAHSELNLIY